MKRIWTSFGMGLALAVALSALSFAQPMAGGMPNPRDISGRPLPDRSLPVGVVTVRVARKNLGNPVAGAELVAIVEAAGGDSRKRTAKTDGEGRATFEGLAPGSRFHAEVLVDGETVKTAMLTIPESGGIRVMLVGGLGPEPEGGGAGGADDDGGGTAGGPRFTLGIVSGTAVMDAELSPGTIRVTARDGTDRPLVGQSVELGLVAPGGQIDVTRAVTDATGVATFSHVGEDKGEGKGKGKPAPAADGAEPDKAPSGVAAAVVMSMGEMRFGTDGFTMPPKGGVRVELRVPEKTSDPAVIVVGPGGRLILQLRDDALGFIETLPLQNPSGKIFDPGVGGIEVPLPSEATNAEGGEGEHKIEVRKGIGVAVHGPIPPRRPMLDPNQKSPDEITFGFILPIRGSTLKFEQRFPNGMGEFTFITEQLAGLSIDSSQLTGRQERELGGKKYWLMRGEPVPAGGTLRFSVLGLPAADDTGKIVAAVLSIGLLLAAILLSRNPGSEGDSARTQERDRLVERREKLFAELVAVEARRARGAATASPPSSPSASAPATPERDDLVRRLENVYRDLATLDDRRAAS